MLFWKSAKKSFYVFIVMPYSHTCGLEHNIFIFDWGMAIQIFLSNGRPYKNHERPPTNVAIFCLRLNFGFGSYLLLCKQLWNIFYSSKECFTKCLPLKFSPNQDHSIVFQVLCTELLVVEKSCSLFHFKDKKKNIWPIEVLEWHAYTTTYDLPFLYMSSCKELLVLTREANVCLT